MRFRHRQVVWAGLLLGNVVAGVLPAEGIAGSRLGIGTGMGYMHFSAHDIDFAEDAVGSSVAGPTLQFYPGLRLSLAGDAGLHEAQADVGFSLSRASDVIETRSLLLRGRYQLRMGPPTRIEPVLIASAGFAYFGIEDLGPAGGGRLSATIPIWGLAVGGNLNLGNGHGRFVGEVGYEWVGQGSDGGQTVVPRGGTIGIRLGFDLFLTDAAQ